MAEVAVQQPTAGDRQDGASKVPQITASLVGMLLTHYSLFFLVRIKKLTVQVPLLKS
jgi:hypothetical protein